jgi:hypothetical protein
VKDKLLTDALSWVERAAQDHPDCPGAAHTASRLREAITFAPKVGDEVEVWNTGVWVEGTLTDMWRGPITGATVYEVGNRGYYAHEIREPVAVNA